MNERFLLSSTGKLCLVALAGVLLTVSLTYEATDGAAVRAAEADKPPAAAVAVPAPNIDFTHLVEAVETRRAELEEERYWAAVPLDQECRTALQEACREYGAPICDALGLIEVESGFRADAVSSEGCYGLCQLNRRWFPADLTPAENIRAGVAYLGELLEKYDGDTQAALTAYNAGRDTGSRTYANAVLAASEKWGNG